MLLAHWVEVMPAVSLLVISSVIAATVLEPRAIAAEAVRMRARLGGHP